MKRKIISLFAAVLVLTAPLGFVGCNIFSGAQPTLSQSASDQIILRAEQTAETSKLTFNTFVHLERDNEVMLKSLNPAIHTWANNIRAHGIDWIVSLRNATKEFKANRTPQNQATLNGILLTITSVLNQTNQYLDQSKKAITQ